MSDSTYIPSDESTVTEDVNLSSSQFSCNVDCLLLHCETTQFNMTIARTNDVEMEHVDSTNETETKPKVAAEQSKLEPATEGLKDDAKCGNQEEAGTGEGKDLGTIAESALSRFLKMPEASRLSQQYFSEQTRKQLQHGTNRSDFSEAETGFAIVSSATVDIGQTGEAGKSQRGVE